MKLYLCFVFCLLLGFNSYAQVKEDTDSKEKVEKGFFTLSTGVSGIGYNFTSIAYNHPIGRRGYLGLELGSYNGDDGAYSYSYTPLLATFTVLSKPKGKGIFTGYGNIKVGQAAFISATPLDPANPPILPASEESIFMFGLHGGTQIRLNDHFFIHLEAGLSNIYSFLGGLTIKL